jgi:stage II sporulation protein M
MKKKEKLSSRKKPTLKKKHNFIYKNFLDALDYTKKLKIHFLFSLTLFFTIGILGFIFPIFFIEEIKIFIQELIQLTSGMNSFELTAYIIYNNIKSALLAIIFGIFFGVIPIAIIVMNGYILGFISSKAAAMEGILILWKLLPHGIFEIPAVLLSTAIGLKLGLFLFTYRGKNKLKEFKNWTINSLKVFIFIIVPLLILAGIIEGILIALTS